MLLSHSGVLHLKVIHTLWKICQSFPQGCDFQMDWHVERLNLKFIPPTVQHYILAKCTTEGVQNFISSGFLTQCYAQKKNVAEVIKPCFSGDENDFLIFLLLVSQVLYWQNFCISICKDVQHVLMEPCNFMTCTLVFTAMNVATLSWTFHFFWNVRFYHLSDKMLFISCLLFEALKRAMVFKCSMEIYTFTYHKIIRYLYTETILKIITIHTKITLVKCIYTNSIYFLTVITWQLTTRKT